MDAKEATQTIVEIFKKIGKADDDIIKITNNLKIILLNLQIQNAHIKENTGIEPIVEELDRSIQNINTSLRGLMEENSKPLTEALKVLYNEINT